MSDRVESSWLLLIEYPYEQRITLYGNGAVVATQLVCTKINVILYVFTNYPNEPTQNLHQQNS
jgi:hypothetical protein